MLKFKHKLTQFCVDLKGSSGERQKLIKKANEELQKI